MRILGISCYFHDAAAAILEDGVLVAAAEEERFTRKKHDYNFPINSIRFCLDYAKIDNRDIDYVIFFEKPFVKFERLLQTAIHGFPGTFSLFNQSVRTWMFDKIWIKSLIVKELGINPANLLFSEHHLSHAASSYFCSPFEESAILTFDGVGEWATTAISYGKGTNLNQIKEIHFPHSLGLLYSAFTAFLGFEVNEGEYKVMGMAPYGEPKFVDKVNQVISQSRDGSFLLDMKYFSFHKSTKKSFTRKFVEMFGEPRNPDIPFYTDTSEYRSYYGEKPTNFKEMTKYNQHYADIASSIQKVTENTIIKLAEEAYKITNSNNLCLAGGVALNSVANNKILSDTRFENLYIQPSAGDGGASLGAALYAWHTVLGNSKRNIMSHAYYGKDYTQNEIISALEKFGLKSKLYENESDLIEQTVNHLCSGKVIGWYQGRFEWGPRALGNRSILADPRSEEMKDIVNTKIKFREPFRPFAPAVLVESAEEYFDITDPSSSYPARFMLQVVPVKASKQHLIPAVSHKGTARIQTVHYKESPRYYNLIKEFGQVTGIPILLNTSFNIRGEPIVTTPENAIETFINTGIDTLVIGNNIISKEK